jgi:hypothetical protein
MVVSQLVLKHFGFQVRAKIKHQGNFIFPGVELV